MSTRLLYNLDDAAAALSLGKRKVEALVRDGDLESVLVGRRRLIPADALAEYVERLRRAS